jgi:FlaA1/EpsC-like NDP-sugar epimerase
LYKKTEYLASFYGEFFILFGLQFCLTYFSRFLFLNKASNQLRREEVWFNTLIIGSHQKASELYKSIVNNSEKTGYRICGFLSLEKNGTHDLNRHIAQLGSIEDAKNIIDEYKIGEVIIALQNNERPALEKNKKFTIK